MPNFDGLAAYVGAAGIALMLGISVGWFVKSWRAIIAGSAVGGLFLGIMAWRYWTPLPVADVLAIHPLLFASASAILVSACKRYWSSRRKPND